MKRLIPILLCVLLGTQTDAKKLDWARSAGDKKHDAGMDVATDAAGNVYTTGYFTDSIDLDPSPAVQMLYSNGGTDVFICKYDAAGNLLWAESVGGVQHDTAFSIVADKGNNILLTGNFHDTVDLDPGTGVFKIAEVTSNALSTDIFLLKLDSAGNFVWAKAITNPGAQGPGISAWSRSVTIDVTGSILLAGQFSGARDFDPGSGTYMIDAQNNIRPFVLKLDAAGDFIWARSWGADNAAYAATDAAGNVFVTGHFKDTVDFDPGPGVQKDSSFYRMTYLLKLNAGGNFQWVKHFTGNLVLLYPCVTMGKGIVINKTNDIFLIGSYDGEVDFDPGTGKATPINNDKPGIYMVKLDLNGNYKGFYTAISNLPFIDVEDIVLGDDGNIYLAGSFESTAYFGDVAQGWVTAFGNRDVFTIKLDSKNGFAWMDHIGGTDDDYGNGVAVSAGGYVYTTGSFGDTIHYDSASMVKHTSAGGQDYFVQKLEGCTVFNISISKSPPYTLTAHTTLTGVTYQWVDCNQNYKPVTGETSKVYHSWYSGDFAVIITKYGCSDTSACLQVYVGIEEIEKNAIRLFPNPTTGKVQVDMGRVYSDVTIKVISVLGQVVTEGRYTSGQEIEIDIPGAAGLYYLSIRHRDGEAMHMPVVKQ